jgi:hypothetical protein
MSSLQPNTPTSYFQQDCGAKSICLSSGPDFQQILEPAPTTECGYLFTQLYDEKVKFSQFFGKKTDVGHLLAVQ